MYRTQDLVPSEVRIPHARTVQGGIPRARGMGESEKRPQEGGNLSAIGSVVVRNSVIEIRCPRPRL